MDIATLRRRVVLVFSLTMLALGGCLSTLDAGTEDGSHQSSTAGGAVAGSGGVVSGSASGTGGSGSQTTSGTGGQTTGGPVCSPPCGANSTCDPSGGCYCSSPTFAPCPADDNGTSCCGEGYVCTSKGTCVCTEPHSECPDGNGGTICTSETLDNNNCGSCGHVCAAFEVCTGGTCNCTVTLCPLPDGGTICVNPLTCG